MILVFGLLSACCGESSTAASRKAMPDPVVAYVGDGDQEQELTASGFKLELFEGGQAKLSLEAQNTYMSLTIVAVIADPWRSTGVKFTDELSFADPRAVAEIWYDGTTLRATEGTLRLKIEELKLEGSFEATMPDHVWNATLTGPVALLCYTRNADMQMRGGAPTDGSASWWLDERFETSFCRESLKSLGWESAAE